MTTLAPSRQKVRAISLPMPLAAPVTTATLLLRFMGRFLSFVTTTVFGDIAEAKHHRDSTNLAAQ
jgi:hypothetical protein